MTDLSDIQRITRDLRDIYESMLLSSIGRAETTGSCLLGAILLVSSLNRFTTCQARICGGGPPDDGGLIDRSGQLQGHYWVEGVTDAGDQFVADLTADQFGYEKVVVLPHGEARLRYIPGDAARVARHVAEELAAIRTETLCLGS